MSGIVSKNAGRGSGIVGAGAIGADAVDSANIADDAIDSEHYTDGSIDNAHIADDAIDSEHYADGSIDNAHIADDAIDSEHYAAGSIDEAHIADNAVTLAKMAGGTDGNIISYDASGNPVAIATGTDGQVLTSTGAGSPPAFEAVAAGGGWEYVSSATASTSATLAFTNMASGYDYEYLADGIFADTAAKGFHFQIGVAGPTYRTTGYKSVVNGTNGAGTGHYAALTTGQAIQNGSGENSGTDADEQVCVARFFINDPANATFKTCWLGDATVYGSSPEMMHQRGSGFYQSTAEANTSIQFFFTGGNIASGTIFQYRRKRS